MEMCRNVTTSSSFLSFTQFFSTCGCMPLPAMSLWPGRQPCRPRLVDGRRGGGPSSVAPRSAIHRRGVVEIAPSPHHCFRTAHSCAQSVKGSPTEPVLSRSSRNRLGHLQSHLTEAGTSVRLSFQSRNLPLLADESSGVTVRMKLFRDFNLLAAGS